MALPFYNQGDQDIYAGGDHFVPQEQYRLNYTPSQSLASTIGNTGGITNTQAAGSYMGYPSYEAWLLAQGGGDGGGNDIPVNRYDPNQNLGPTNITDYEADAYDVGSTWAGSWAKAKDLYSRLPLPSNFLRKGIMKWRENKEIKKQEKAKAAADKIVSDRAAQNANKNRSIYDGGYRSVDSSGNAVSFSSPQGTTTFDSKSGRGRRDYDRGGRIGMAKGKMPIPKAKKSGSFPWETSLIGLASLFNRRPLMLGKIKGINPGEYGTRQWRANKMKNLARMGGKWAGRTRFAAPALMNPWLMAPAALGLGAKYAVGKAFDPYRDETGKIGAEGHAQLASAARAREALMAQRNAARQNRRDGGLAGIL